MTAMATAVGRIMAIMVSGDFLTWRRAEREKDGVTIRSPNAVDEDSSLPRSSPRAQKIGWVNDGYSMGYSSSSLTNSSLKT